MGPTALADGVTESRRLCEPRGLLQQDTPQTEQQGGWGTYHMRTPLVFLLEPAQTGSSQPKSVLGLQLVNSSLW